MKAIIKEQVKAQVSKIMPQIEKYITESLGAEVLVRSTNKPQTSYAVAAHFKAYNSDKDIITSYGDVVTLKRGRDDQDKDEDTPPLDQTEGQKEESKSTQAEEPELDAVDTEMQQDQWNESGHVDDQPDNEAAPKHDRFLTSDKPPTPDHAWNKSKSIDSRPPQKWISTIAKA
ncbi:hypothetical protein Tco_0717475 [Tanacetum coccineum]